MVMVSNLGLVELLQSKFKQSYRTDANNPSRNLIKNICYAAESKFTNSAVAWGLEMESIAVADYIKKMQGFHKEFHFSKVRADVE